jgi:AbrB family looped-hinge helix DNA binding protein
LHEIEIIAYTNMAKSKKCCSAKSNDKVSNQIEAIITVDERGQMVLPKETRARAGINAGDKLALVSWSKNGRVCCLSLVRAEEMAETIGEMLNSLMVNHSEQE